MAISVHKPIKTVAIDSICVAYLVAYLEFHPSNSQIKCRDRAHSSVGNGRHTEISRSCI